MGGQEEEEEEEEGYFVAARSRWRSVPRGRHHTALLAPHLSAPPCAMASASAALLLALGKAPGGAGRCR